MFDQCEDNSEDIAVRKAERPGARKPLVLAGWEETCQPVGS